MKQKFKHAIDGLIILLHDKSILIQIILAICTILFCFFYHLNVTQWVLVIVLCMMVILLEMINTIIEEICNLISEQYNPRIKKIKDCSAGLVFAGCIFAIILFILILLKII